MTTLTPFQPAPYGVVPVSAIDIDESRNVKLTPFSLKKLEGQYLRGLQSPQERFATVAAYYGKDTAHARRIYDYISNLWFMPATPILSNGGTTYGLPASCFVNEAQDTLRGIRDLWNENMFLAAKGGGIGCVDSETEYLTPLGWKKISEYADEEIMVVDEKGLYGSFEKPQRYISGAAGKMYRLSNSSTDMVVSEDHRNFVIFDGRGSHAIKTTKEVIENPHFSTLRFKPWVLSHGGSGLPWTDLEIRFLVALAADGFEMPHGSCIRFAFRRQRKIDRIKKLAELLGLPYDEETDGVTTTFHFRNLGLKKLPLTFEHFGQATPQQLVTIYSELGYWDGSFDIRNDHLHFSTVKAEEADFAQYVIMSATGFRASIRHKSKGEIVVAETGRTYATVKEYEEFVPEDGKQYCFTTSSGLWLARRNGFIFVTGNSYWGNLRSDGEAVGKNGHSSGVIPFIHVMDSLTLAISQGCVDGDTEILTENGFVKFSDLSEKDGRVWQVDENAIASLVTPSEYHKYPYTGVMHHYVSTDRHGDVVLEQFVTPNHRLVKTDHGKIIDLINTKLSIVQSEDYVGTNRSSFIRMFPDDTAGIQDATRIRHSLAGFNITTRDDVQFSGDVYCVTVPSGMFIVRKNGTICVTGNSLRRGSAAVYMPIWHPEIEEFIEMRRPTGGDPNRKNQNLHHGVVISNAFMRQVEIGGNWDLRSPKDGSVITTIPARNLWIRLLTARLEQGEPYILWEDQINDVVPWYQKEAGLYVKTSNLCVHGDTMILTKEGEKRIADIAGTDQWLWNGEEWSLSRVEKTSDNAVMRRITFSNDKTLTVTDAHKFYIRDGGGVEVEVSAKDLKPTMLLSSWQTPDGECKTVSVSEIEENYAGGATYCANEPKRHRIILNEILTGNCSEITLPTGIDQYGKDRTAVCFLASPNLETYDEWKDHPTFIEDIYYFMDAVVQDLIDNAPPEMASAAYGAFRERAVGVGVMGFHSFLQQRMIPFESAMAKVWNKRIFRTLRQKADAASIKIAQERGSCPDAADKGVVERFSCKIAVAPTASISIVCGESSPGIDPIARCLYLQKTLTGNEEVKNKHLLKLLEERGMNTPQVWSHIRNNGGSVQKLEGLTPDEKAVFKTAFELDQRWIIEHASDRTPYICQAQPVNLFLPPDIHKADLHGIHMLAWEKGLKSLYYCRSYSLKQADSITEGGPMKAEERDWVPTKYDECLSCQ